MVITRFHDIERIDATVEFLTPTFLGGADQQAELRSAPFKSLLRQWWRIAYPQPNSEELRKKEGELFGSVDETDAQTSFVRIAMAKSAAFFVSNANFVFGKSNHPEARGGLEVENCLYLGYGPITYDHGLAFRRYITPGSVASLTIDVPKSDKASIQRVLSLINVFGTVGSRCRNGYGSITVLFDGKPRVLQATSLGAQAVGNFFLPYDMRQFPHGFGQDARGILCWQTQPATDWKSAMQNLASIYIKIRVNTPIAGAGVQKRHILGYPVTHHELYNWGGSQGRMPSQLRLKVAKLPDGKLVGRIFHIPHKIPNLWGVTVALGTELSVWQDIHGRLDREPTLTRVPTGGTL